MSNLIHYPLYSLFFGDAISCPLSATHLKPASAGDRHSQDFFPWADKLHQNLGLTHLIFQKQIHGTDGWNITNTDQLTGPLDCFTHTGDFLITNQPNVGIGVLTADCLPVILCAPPQRIVAIAHAGWPGTVKNIALEMLASLQQHYGVKANDIQVYFGPSAQSCCYEVTAEFEEHLRNSPYVKKVLTQRDGRLYFDNPGLNKLQLMAAGVNEENINVTEHKCTICNNRFHSYRRAADKKNYGTQATIVWMAKS
jgi:YfiH family protein